LEGKMRKTWLSNFDVVLRAVESVPGEIRVPEQNSVPWLPMLHLHVPPDDVEDQIIALFEAFPVLDA
jgi:hypothetical protein